MKRAAAVGVEFMIPWLGRIRRTQEKSSRRRSKTASGAAGTWTRPEQHRAVLEGIAALETIADDHDRLAHEFEQAAAVHREAATHLRARINSLVVHQEVKIGGQLALREGQEQVAALSQYLIVARLLGPFEVAVRGAMIERWRSQRAASLLKYLLF